MFYLWRAGLGLSRIQAASQCFKSVTGRTPKAEVQLVRSGFLGNIGNGIDSKQADHGDFNTKFLRYFPAQRGLHHIVSRAVAQGGDVRVDHDRKSPYQLLSRSSPSTRPVEAETAAKCEAGTGGACGGAQQDALARQTSLSMKEPVASQGTGLIGGAVQQGSGATSGNHARPVPEFLHVCVDGTSMLGSSRSRCPLCDEGSKSTISKTMAFQEGQLLAGQAALGPPRSTPFRLRGYKYRSRVATHQAPDVWVT